jgi:hypothetical protein
VAGVYRIVHPRLDYAFTAVLLIAPPFGFLVNWHLVFGNSSSISSNVVTRSRHDLIAAVRAHACAWATEVVRRDQSRRLIAGAR